MSTAGKLRTLYNFGPNRDDGRDPDTGVIWTNGLLYGTLHNGGTRNNGVAFFLMP